MCDDHGTDTFEFSDADPALDPVLAGHTHHPTRRSVLTAGVLGFLGAGSGLFAGVRPALALAASSPLSPILLVRVANHVHATCSEGLGSWESQFAQAAALPVDALYMTDHDFRALAYNYLTSLNALAMVATSSGSFAQKVTTNTKGTVRTVAEAAGSSSAWVKFALQEKPLAWNRLRTYIAGHLLTVTFPSCRIDAGGTYELVVDLSNHPAYGVRPAGQFYLRYRFGPSLAPGRFVDGTGLTGVVTAPTPTAGSKVTLDLQGDVAALWPDMLALDNAFTMFSMVATSPKKGSVVDVSVSVQFARSQNDSASLIANQQLIIDTYGPRYPAMAVYPSVEISRLDPHIIPFGVPQFWPDQTTITPANHDAAYDSIVGSVHAQGGLVSWNHPFGAQGGPLQSVAQQATNRRAIFAAMMADGRLATDILEVGYTVRGYANTQAHLDLWDTFSRWAVFMTGNGVNDDHGGLHWSTLNNGFATGLWAASTSQADMVAALASGRAFTYHAGKFVGAQLDMLVDGAVPMGKVSVSSATSRSLAIYASSLPTGSFVDVYQGPVDYTGSDPGTTRIASLPASSFTGSGVASLAANTSTSTFVRVQVRNSAGAIVGIGNPTWLLQAPPPNGIPIARAA